MRVSGLETRSKALESTPTSLQMRSMMVNGRMERSVVRVELPMPMVLMD